MLICIETFMWWCDITLNALLLLIMLYVHVIELYNMCLMHDGQYWWCTLTMQMGHYAWVYYCMYCMLHAFVLLDSWLVVGEPQIPLCGLDDSWFWRWWNRWDVIRGDGDELMTLILRGEDQSGEPECSRWYHMHWVGLLSLIALYIGCIYYYVDGWLCC